MWSMPSGPQNAVQLMLTNPKQYFWEITREEQLELSLPGGEVSSCAFLAPTDLDARQKSQLRCFPVSSGTAARVTSRGASFISTNGTVEVQDLSLLPQGPQMSFKLRRLDGQGRCPDSRPGALRSGVTAEARRCAQGLGSIRFLLAL
eukprot:s410_g2.t1